MSKESNFLIYCMERYRHFKGLSGADVTKTFEKAGLSGATLKYFGKYHKKGYKKPSLYTKAQLRKKKKILSNYRSQRSIHTFAHMNPYENWTTAK